MTALRNEIAQLMENYEQLQSQLVETRELFLLQEVGLHEYSHPLDSSAAYKDTLETLETEMQRRIKIGEAGTGTKRWAINDSEKDGARMVADFCKLMLRAYNNEADNIVRTLKPYALRSALDRLQKNEDVNLEARLEHEDRNHRQVPCIACRGVGADG